MVTNNWSIYKKAVLHQFYFAAHWIMSTYYERFCTIQIVNELQLLPGVHYSINLTFMGVQRKIKEFLRKRCWFQLEISMLNSTAPIVHDTGEGTPRSIPKCGLLVRLDCLQYAAWKSFLWEEKEYYPQNVDTDCFFLTIKVNHIVAMTATYFSFVFLNQIFRRIILLMFNCRWLF